LRLFFTPTAIELHERFGFLKNSYIAPMRKGGEFVIKDLDMGKRTVVAAFSAFNIPDSDGDITLPTAFDKTFREQGPEGANRVKHLYNHERVSLTPIGVVKRLWRDEQYAYFESQMRDTPLASDVLKGYEDGSIKEHSYWAKAINPDRTPEGGYILKELRLMEVSTVIWGAQEKALLMEISKGEFTDLAAFENRLKSLQKWVRNATANDELLSDLEAELYKAEDLLKHIQPLRPQSAAPKPVAGNDLTLGQIFRILN
jgi:HK97 family phage prohead protease